MSATLSRTVRNHDEVPARIAGRHEFKNKTGSLSARWHDFARFAGVGVLPPRWREVLRDIEGQAYIVYSYETPIAWARPGDEFLTVPDVRYSQTTTQHQHMCLNGRVGGVMPSWNAERNLLDPGSPIVTYGKMLKLDDPDVFRKGKGASPFGPRYGW